jgi:3'-5' exoribonuclease
MSKHTFIADFENSQYLDGVYCIYNAQLGQTKAGKPYLKALIRDKSGQIAARMWNITEQQFKALPTNGFVWLEGQTQPYQGERQLIVQDIKAVEVAPEDLPNLLPATDKDVDQMMAELRTLLGTLKHPAIKALVDEYLSDKPLMEALRASPAAVSMHHAYLGGLLEHTLQLCTLADLMLPRYPKLNRDLVITGLFLHDLGKCLELSYEYGFTYTNEGQLVGHIVLGSLWLQRKAEAIKARGGVELPHEALLVLHHIILSHHGILEYGAAKVPSTPEAIFVSRLDELDAKTQMGIDHARSGVGVVEDGESDFTEKIWALDTRLYRPDPLA